MYVDALGVPLTWFTPLLWQMLMPHPAVALYVTPLKFTVPFKCPLTPVLLTWQFAHPIVMPKFPEALMCAVWLLVPGLVALWHSVQLELSVAQSAA
jgi:hypothetical protein